MDRVITIHDWWDGPRLGIAYFSERLCVYQSIFDEAADEYSDEYDLFPINKEEAAEIMQDWKEWCMAVSNGTIDSYYQTHTNSKILITGILHRAGHREKFRRKAHFSGSFEKGFIPVDYFAEWYD